MLIVSNKYRLATVLVPKCASTTLISLFANLHELQAGSRDREVLNNIPRSPNGIDRTKEIIALESQRLIEARTELADYVWFSVVRNPYGRLLSNYHNKINRFCANFRKDLYLRYKLAQVLGGPKAWRDVRVAMPFLRSRVSYREFVRTLGEKGLDWDRHYMRQADLLELGEVEYTRLLRLESLQEEMAVLFCEAGLPRHKIDALGDLGRLNVSRREAMDGAPEEMAERPAVHELYRDDFTKLGYAA